jgi:hypothetical protein
MTSNKSDDDRYPDYENLLDDLYSLQKNLLPGEKIDPDTTIDSNAQLPPSVTDEDVHNLEIPILSEVVDSEIYDEQQLKVKFNSAQQHLFEQPPAPQPITDEQINAVVTKLMVRMRPKFEQLLRDKIHSMVVERFNREN